MSERSKLGVVVGPTRYADPATREVRFTLDLLDLDLDEGEPRRVELDFFGHGVAFDPSRRTRAAVFEKRGPGAACVDLVAREVVAKIAPTEGCHFYGHGAYTGAGDALFAIENDLATNEGKVSVRDARTFDVLDVFPTFGAAPHDCHLVEDGATLAITNGGGPLGGPVPCVTFVDVATRKLLEKQEVDEPRINTGHLAVGPARSFAVVSAPRDGIVEEGALGGVSLRSAGGDMKHAREPRRIVERMLGESLSVCIHPREGVAVATHPYGHLVTFWRLDRSELFAAVDLPHPRGVALTLDERYYAVSFGPAASLLLFETKPLRAVTEREVGARRFGGSHIAVWEKA